MKSFNFIIFDLMISKKLNFLLDNIDIVDFFSRNFPQYIFESHSNSYVIKNSFNPFEDDRFIFFKENNKQYFYYLKEKNKGSLFDLITISDIQTFTNHSKFKVASIILKKYYEQENKVKTNYKYFKKKPGEKFLYEYLFKIFKLNNNTKFKKETNQIIKPFIKYFNDKRVIPIHNLESSIPITYRYLNDQRNKSIKSSNGVFALNYFQNDNINNLYLFYRNQDLLDYIKKNYNPTNSYISVLENSSRNLINDVTIKNKDRKFKKLILIDSHSLSVNYFNFLIIMNYDDTTFSRFQIKKQFSENLELNSKIIHLMVNIDQFPPSFVDNLYRLIAKATAYNNKIQKDYKSHISEEYNEFYLSYNTIIIHKKNERVYQFHIPLEKQALSLFNRYFIALCEFKYITILSQ